MRAKTITALLVSALSGLASPAPVPEVWRDRHVIIIGVDGLSVDGVSKAHMRRLHELMARGSWTLEARGVMPTLSSPNWESAISGSAPEQHGITSNGWLRHLVEFKPVCRGADGKYPTIFGLMRAAYPASRIAVFHDWEGFADLVEKSAPDVMRHEWGPAKTTHAAIQYWKANRPALMFIHLDNVDHTGHDHGWTSKQYYAAAEEADGYIGEVLDMVDALSARDSTYILVTADHGGAGHKHGKNTLREILIPWVFAGPGVPSGQISVPVNTFDTALTVAWIFQLDPPQCWIGRPVLAAFSPSLVASHANLAKASMPDCAPGGKLAGAALTRQSDKVSAPVLPAAGAN